MASGRIRGITIEIGGDTTKLQKALSGVDKALSKTQGALKDTNKLLKLDPTNTDLLRQKQKLLGDAIKDTKKRIGELRDAQSKVSEGTAEYDAIQREIIETEQNLKDLEKQAKSAASVLGTKMQEAGNKIKEVGDSITSVGSELSTKVTAPLVAIGALGVAKFAEVDKTMQLTNKTMGNTEEQAEMLNKAMKDAAGNSTFGMNDAATATLNFARAGLTAEEAAAALAPAMNLAAGEGGNLDTVSAGLVATINGFGDSFDDAENYADVFATACNNTALDIDSLSSAMSTAAPVFAAAGYSVNDAALYMGVMANAGIGAEEAATSLKTGLARLVDPSKEGAEQLDKLGISVTNADGSMKDSVQIQKELHDAFEGLSESEQLSAASAIFGKNQMDKWLALIRTSPEDVSELDGALSDCSGTTKEMSDAMMSGFGGSLEKLKSSIDVLVTSLGEALAPTIEKVAGFIQKLVDAFNSLTPEQQTTIATIGMIVAAVGPLLVILGTIISTIGTIVGAIGTVITVVGPIIGMIAGIIGSIQSFAGLMTVVIAILSGPVGIVIAIAAVIAAGIALWKNWDKVKAKALELKNKVVQTFATLKQNTIDKFNEIKNKIKEKIQDARDQAVQKVQDMKDKVVQKFTDIKDKAKEKFDDIKNSIKEKIEWARDKVQAAVDKIKGFFNFKWSLPKLKLPHFSISGSFSLNPPSVPHLSVDWYKTAMGNGMIFTNPTIFGMANGRLQGAGDAGPELVIGMSSLERMIREATASYGSDPSVIYSAVKAGMQDADIGIYLMDRQVGRTLRDMGVAFNG